MISFFVTKRKEGIIMKYKVGDRVRIVDTRPSNGLWNDKMDKWLGKTMTIRGVYEYATIPCYRMEEDREDRYPEHKDGWAWSEKWIAGLAPFTKSDLKNGDIVLFRNGQTAVFIENFQVLVTSDHWCNFYSYSDTLTAKDRQYDIMKVSRPLHEYQCRLSVFAKGTTHIIYERKEPRKMTLAQVCAALGEEIVIVEEE